jgi:hypothetical protein
MLGAAYLLYLAARELFDRDIAIIATVIFCLHPIVVFTSTAVRPYAFAALATNAAILILLRLRHNTSNWLPALFGLSAAFIVYFHFLFAVILPALVLCFFTVTFRDHMTLWRKAGVALAAFALAFLPVIPGLLYLFRTSGTHVCQGAPSLADLATTLTPGWLLPIFGMIMLVAAVRARSDEHVHFQGWHILLCVSLALIPILILYGVSVETSLVLFAAPHCLVAVPGIALCWALVLHPFRSRAVRLLFSVAFVATTAFQNYSAPSSTRYAFEWKNGLDYVERNASVDDAPVLICSGFVESNYAAMPLDSAKDSLFFAPLSYYKLSVPVVPLPNLLNDEAIRVGSRFLQEATQKHERFLAVAYKQYGTLEWLTQKAAATHSVRKLGVFDGVEVLEFVPRTGLAPSGN